jgi:class 3 adenylate cyclase
MLRGARRTDGITFRWVELPWAWVAERWMSCVRVYDTGPVTRGVISYTIEPSGDRESVVHVALDWYTRGTFRRLAVAVGEHRARALYRRTFDRIARALAEQAPTAGALAQPAPPLTEEARQRLPALRARLVEGGVAPSVADLLVTHVAQGDDLDLARIRVRPLARRAGVDERDLVVACLHATRAGLLRLQWEAICPHCRAAKRTVASLGDVPRRVRCAPCEAEFTTDGPHAVEITFGVHPAIRAVPRQTYCYNEASSKAHVVLQQPVPSGGRRTISLSLAPGRYRARIVGEPGHRAFDVVEGSAVSAAILGEGEGPLEVGTHATVMLASPGAKRRVFVIEDVRWADDALRPAHLFNLQEFRDFFSAEHLAPDVELHVGEQTILFSDIVGSTLLYQQKGDSRAFTAVKRHFSAIYEEVRAGHGAVVKTIGDAVMAAFQTPDGALRAAGRIQRRFHGDDAPFGIRVRLSLNAGPCIAVNLNSGIDYFGQTVNLAAKLQSYAAEGQVAFPASLRADRRVAALLEEEGGRVDEGTTTLTSTGQTMRVCCWDVCNDPLLVDSVPRSAGFY